MSQNQDPPVNFISHEMAKRLGLVKQENAVESKFPFKKSPDYSKERKSQCVDSFHDASTQKVNYISNEMAKRLGFVKPENAVESTISLEESFDSSEGRNSQFADASIQKVNIISHKVVNRLSSVDQENTLTDTSSISETLTSSEERESQSVNSLHDPLTQENKNNVKRLGFVNQGNTPTDTSSISETLNSSEEREMNMNVVDGVNSDASELHGSRAQTQASHAVDLTHMTYKEFAQKMNMNVVDGVNNDASELHGSHAQNLDGVNALGTQTQTNIVDGVNNHGMGSNTANQSHAVDLTHMTYKEFAQKMNVNVVDGVNNDVSEFHGSQTHVVDGVDNNVMESNIPKDFQIGDRVRVKDFDTVDWKFGVVTQVKPLRAIVDRGLASFAWIFIEHLESTVNSDDVINISPLPVTEERGSTVDKVEDEKDAKTDSTDHSIQKRKKKRGKQAKTKSWWSTKRICYVAILAILALGTIAIAKYQEQNKEAIKYLDKPDEFSKENQELKVSTEIIDNTKSSYSKKKDEVEEYDDLASKTEIDEKKTILQSDKTFTTNDFPNLSTTKNEKKVSEEKVNDDEEVNKEDVEVNSNTLDSTTPLNSYHMEYRIDPIDSTDSEQKIFRKLFDVVTFAQQGRVNNVATFTATVMTNDGTASFEVSGLKFIPAKKKNEESKKTISEHYTGTAGMFTLEEKLIEYNHIIIRGITEEEKKVMKKKIEDDKPKLAITSSVPTKNSGFLLIDDGNESQKRLKTLIKNINSKTMNTKELHEDKEQQKIAKLFYDPKYTMGYTGKKDANFRFVDSPKSSPVVITIEKEKNTANEYTSLYTATITNGIYTMKFENLKHYELTTSQNVTKKYYYKKFDAGKESKIKLQANKTELISKIIIFIEDE